MYPGRPAHGPRCVPNRFSTDLGCFVVSDSLEREIGELRALYWSERDPEGRGFAPLADAYRRAGNLNDALELLQDGLARHPEFASGHVVAARVHLALEDNDAARTALEAVLALDDQNTEALAELGGIHEVEGRAEEALDLFKRLSISVPGDDRVASRVRSLQDLVGGAGAEEPGAEEEGLPVHDASQSVTASGQEGSERGPSDESGSGSEEMEAETGEEDETDEPFSIEPLAFDADALNPDLLGQGSADLSIFEAAVESEVSLEAAEGGDDDLAWHLPDEEVPGDGDDDEEIFTRTLGELYADQGLTHRAVEVFQHLAAADPNDESLQARLAELEGLPVPEPFADAAVESSEADAPTTQETDAVMPTPAPTPPRSEADEAALEALAEDLVMAPDDEGELTTPFAWSESEAESPADDAGPPVAEYFARLLSWVPADAPVVVPIESLAPDPGMGTGGSAVVVPIESLAPDSEQTEPESKRVAQFQDWMNRLKK